MVLKQERRVNAASVAKRQSISAAAAQKKLEIDLFWLDKIGISLKSSHARRPRALLRRRRGRGLARGPQAESGTKRVHAQFYERPRADEAFRGVHQTTKRLALVRQRFGPAVERDLPDAHP